MERGQGSNFPRLEWHVMVRSRRCFNRIYKGWILLVACMLPTMYDLTSLVHMCAIGGSLWQSAARAGAGGSQGNVE